MKKIALTLISFMVFTQGLYAESIGTVVKVKGDVAIIDEAGQVSFAKALAELPVGATVQTGEGAYAKLIMKDDTVFQVGPNSDFSLEEFDFKTKNERKAVYSLAKGQLRSWFVHKSKDKTLTIKTPTASMGIRGTEILTDVYADGDGKTKTDIALVRGKLDVNSEAFGSTITLIPGQLLDSIGEKVEGRSPASAKQTYLKNLSQRVFQAVSRNSSDSDGAIFLHDARKKFGNEKLKGRIFKRAKGRLPASSVQVNGPKTSQGSTPTSRGPINGSSIVERSVNNITINNAVTNKMQRATRQAIRNGAINSAASQRGRLPASRTRLRNTTINRDGTVLQNFRDSRTGESITLPAGEIQPANIQPAGL